MYQNWTVNVQYYVPTALQILSRSTKACVSYYNFSKVCETKTKKKKIKKKNTKKIRQTLKVRISVMDGRIHLKFRMGGTLPRGVSTAKMVNLCPTIIEIRMRENGVFLVPVKYTLVCRAPALAVLGHTTHYGVSFFFFFFFPE